MVKLWSCFPWVFWNLCSLSQLLPTSYLSSCWSDAPFYGSEWSEESFGGIYETLVPYLKVASITFLLTQDFLWDAFFLFFSTRCRNVARLRWPFSRPSLVEMIGWTTVQYCVWGTVAASHAGIASCRNRITGSQKKTPRSRPKRRCWAKAWRGVLRDFCPLISI